MANIGYRSWEVAGNPWQVYSELKNWDIAPVPHTQRQELWEFWFRKRESYRAIWALSQLDMFRWYRFTDVRKIDETWCGWCDEDTECCCTFYYAVNADKSRYAIVKTSCDNPCNPIIIDCWQRCPCASERFFKVYGRNSEILNDTTDSEVSVAEIWNENSFGWMYTNWDISTLTEWPQPWDYVQIVWVTNDGNAVCWGIREVVWVTDYTWDEDWKYQIQLSQPWSWISWTDHLKWAEVISFQEIDWVPWYITREWVQTIVWCADGVDNSWNCAWDAEDKISIWDNLCEIGSNTCIVSAHQHNGTLTYLNDKWYSYYGWIGFDSNQPNNNNVQFVGSDKIDSVSFKNFIINFWKTELNAITFDETWAVSYLRELETSWIWIKNKWAWAKFDWWLYFVGSDNRIYWASLQSNGLSYDIDMKDITTNIRWHMDLIQENDEVYLASDAWVLYIFINGRDRDTNQKTNKTKILKYYKDFEFWWPWHEVCGEVITWLECWQFIWESVYEYCWWDWDGEAIFAIDDEYWVTHWYWKWYEAVAEWTTYWMNQHGMVSADWLKLNMFRKHKLMRWNILLWWGIYTDATRIEIKRANKYIRERYHKIDSDNCWIKSWKEARNCQDVTVTECFKNWLDKCDNMINKCAWASRNCFDVDPRCVCEWKKRIFEDYCICYDDAAYALSPIESMEMKFDDKRATYHKVRFVSWYNIITWDNGIEHQVNDIGYFLWMIIETDSEQWFFNQLEPFSKECCDPPMECPLDSCGN